MAKIENTEEYKTYLEYHYSLKEMVDSTNEIYNNGGRAAVAGIIRRCISESAVIHRGETREKDDRISTPTHLGHKPKRTDVSTINPYSLESMSTTSALVPHNRDDAPKVHEEVAKEKHRPPSPGDRTSTARPKETPRQKPPKRLVT